MGAEQRIVSTAHVEAFARSLKWIEDPAVQKTLIMAKREHGELTDEETARLIREFGLEEA